MPYEDHPFSLYQSKRWAVRCRCKACGETRVIGPDQLVERFGAERTLGEIKPRLRCPSCGSAEIVTAEVQSQDGGPRFQMAPPPGKARG